MTKENLEIHSHMLGQIGNLVSEYCDGEMTTLAGVEALIADRDNETKWADHYCRALRRLQSMGKIPDGFTW
jgi:hypothetical protein